MANVNLPAPILVAGGALCLLGGYLIGVVAGPDTPDLTTGVVTSWEASKGRLCLSGDNVADQDGADEDGTLCGRWQRTAGAKTPREGDNFRFVSVERPGKSEDDPAQVVIYGDVVD